MLTNIFINVFLGILFMSFVYYSGTLEGRVTYNFKRGMQGAINLVVMLLAIIIILSNLLMKW